MSLLTRRQFIGSVASVATSASLIPQLARVANAAPAKNRPSMLVHIMIKGGMDAILTTDPKVRSEMNPRADLFYKEGDIISGGRIRIGPYLKPFERYLSKMAILNGVVGSTVSHETGQDNLQEMRRTFPRRSMGSGEDRGSGTGLVGTLGALRAGYPVDSIRFNHPYYLPSGRNIIAFREFLPDDMAAQHSVIPTFSRLAREGRRKSAVVAALAREAARCPQGHAASCVPADVVRALIERMPEEPLPEPPQIGGPDADTARRWAIVLRDVLFTLRHRLTPALFIFAPAGDIWDSHQRNQTQQQYAMDMFAPAMLYFLDELEKRTTVDGVPLSKEVGIVLSSELGRFPIINNLNGKDHFPEFPAILMGPGLRYGQYGHTDSNMVSQPISLQTGRPNASQRDIVPTIDDLGATLLHWFGIEDTASVGYLGRRLDFLLA